MSAPPASPNRPFTKRIAVALLAVAVAALAVAGRPIGPRAFGGGANALAFEDRAGLPLGTVLARDTEHAVRVPLGGVSPRFLAAVVAAEDARFAAHDGVDAVALARAAWQVLRTGHIVSGGSTITMQLARLRWNLPRTPLGKLDEIVLARRIEAGTSKAAILEAYVNRLPMGGDLVGVEAGARTYFGTPAAELDLAHAAFLAALPNDPVRLDPYEHRDALEARRRVVLARMVATGAASAGDAARAASERIDVLARSEGIGAAPHLLFRLAANVPPGATRVRTTIDRDLQAFAENATQQVVGALGERGARDGAAIVIDNHDGAILAYVGSADYFAHVGAGKNDGVVALRQPGSTLKPFLYELAFEKRAVRPTTILADVPTTYSIPGRKAYSPGDYSERFAGPVRARIALADSLNVPAVHVLSDVGVRDFLERLHALGFVHLTHDADHYGLGLALGDGEVTLEELAGAYATIANGGRAVHVHALADANGEARSGPRQENASADGRDNVRVGATREWSLVTDILSDAHARARAFGVASLLRTPFASAVKTGTSSDFRDTWTVGFTRDYTVAAWVGNFNGAPMQRVSGVTGAAPLWNRIVRRLSERERPAAFAPPHGYVRRPMCATTGVRPTRDCRSVVGEWLDAGDLIAWNAPPRPLDRRYDAWLAAQPPQRDDTLRIVAPHDGDVFVAAPGARIAVIARGAPQAVWELNGKEIGPHGARWTLPLERGRWTLRAHHGMHADAVTFTVGDPVPHARRAGFTIRG
ncbi:MAG: penicillin-binding protein [Candidatus Eremiobacteraeota bacterium]|nr:penicillin-binding protein [Candidatus Eremiobacteraeota bacterium]